MTQPLIHRSNRALTASNIRQAVADDLSQIKSEDGLTWADIGRIMGKSEDQAAKYADASAEIGIVAYAFARREWNGRFTGTLDRLIAGTRGEVVDDRTKLGIVLRAAMAIAGALEDDNQMDAHEVRQNRATLEAAREEIDALLGKLTVRAA